LNDRADMLQLTEAENGNVTGVLTEVSLTSDGKLATQSASITVGTIDNNQITLTLNPALFGTNLSGIRQGQTITLQRIGDHGDIEKEDFALASMDKFGNLTDGLRAKGLIITKTNELTEFTLKMQRTIAIAEDWISKSNIHLQRIGSARDRYEKISDFMSQHVAKERDTLFSARRAQVAVDVSQADVIANQMDIAVDGLWDNDILPTGNQFQAELERENQLCGEDASKHSGIPSAVTDSWSHQCLLVKDELAKFSVAHQNVLRQRLDLGDFEKSERTKRSALVREANQLEK